MARLRLISKKETDTVEHGTLKIRILLRGRITRIVYSIRKLQVHRATRIEDIVNLKLIIPAETWSIKNTVTQQFYTFKQ